MTEPEEKVEDVEGNFNFSLDEDPTDNGSLAVYFVYEKDGEEQQPLARLAYTRAGSQDAAKKLAQQVANLLGQIFVKMDQMKSGEPQIVLPNGNTEWKKDA